MIVVSDTGPINYLILIGQIDLLPVLCGEILLPPEVHVELQDEGAPAEVRRWARHLPSWVSIQKPLNRSTMRGLGQGELAALALAQEIDAPLLCDDGAARTAARRLGLSVSGTLGVLQLGHARRLLEIRDPIAALKGTNFRYAPGLFDRVIEQAEAMRERL